MTGLLALVLLPILPAAAHAAGTGEAAGTADAAGLTAERARLRSELDRVNTEIDSLKRTGGVADDYRLRARLADAESLARRLMEIDARLGARAGVPAANKIPQPPTAAPTDGPTDLEAKADILTDLSRRLRVQADSFSGRAKEIKGRQELRRRAADLDRDPFAAMEGSRRRVASSASANAGGHAFTPPSGGFNSQPASAGSSGPVPGGSGVTSIAGSDKAQIVPVPVSSSALDKGADNAQSLALQLRDLVDPATLADLRRLEPGTSGSSTQALERAAAALRARALELDARARTMRAQAHQPRR